MSNPAESLGRALADTATHEAHERGLALKVIANPRARRYYKQCGFSEGEVQARFGPALGMTN